MTNPLTSWGEVSGLARAVAVIFGVSDGIGLACARAAAAAGASVACVDVNPDVAAHAVNLLREGGATAAAFTADVCQREEIREVVNQIVDRFGAIDHCVDVVGASPLTPVVDGDDDAWDVAIALNLRQAYLVAGEVLPQLRSRAGSLVFISSVSALTSMPNKAAYGAAKAGVISLVKTLAVENGELGVRINAVAPGVTLTPAIQQRDAGPAGDAVRATIPMRRGGETSEIANAVVFLISDLASYVSGQVIAADGAVSSKYCLPVTQAGFSSGRSVRDYFAQSPEGRREVLAARNRPRA